MEIKNFETEQPVNKDPLTRRDFISGVSALFGAAILSACTSEKPMTQEPTKTAPEKTTTSAITIEIPRDKNIQLPEFVASERPVVFGQPEDLNMNDQEFKSLSDNITTVLKQGVREFLIPQLKSGKDKNSTIQSFVSQTAEIIGTSCPQARNAMDMFAAKWNNDVDGLVAQINKFINPSGQNLQIDTLPGGILEIEFNEIVGSSYMEVKDSKGRKEVPMLKLKQGVINGSNEPLAHGGLGTCDAELTRTLMFEEKAKPAAEYIRKKLPPLPNYKNNLGENEYIEAVQNDFLKHEATHVFLADRFPKVGKQLDRNALFRVPLEVNTTDGKGAKISLSGTYAPVMFQELCGVGVQIGQTTTGTPHSISMYFTDEPHLADNGYRLVTQIMPLAVLEIAPDCPLKREITQILTKDGEIDYDKLRQLIGNPPFTQEHTKKVGELLYQLGYTLLEKGEKGELK